MDLSMMTPNIPPYALLHAKQCHDLITKLQNLGPVGAASVILAFEEMQQQQQWEQTQLQRAVSISSSSGSVSGAVNDLPTRGRSVILNGSEMPTTIHDLNLLQTICLTGGAPAATRSNGNSSLAYHLQQQLLDGHVKQHQPRAAPPSHSQPQQDSVPQTQQPQPQLKQQQQPHSTNRSNLPTSLYDEPGEYDVVWGRGKGSYNSPGNKRFRAMIRMQVPEYKAARTQSDKSMVLIRIIEQVRAQNNGRARFVKRHDDGSWLEIGDKEVREKVGHAMWVAVKSSIKDDDSNNNKKGGGASATVSSNNPGCPKKKFLKRMSSGSSSTATPTPTTTL